MTSRVAFFSCSWAGAEAPGWAEVRGHFLRSRLAAPAVSRFEGDAFSHPEEMAMLEFFHEGGWGMYPVLVLGLMLMVSAARYALDGEPVRLRFIGVSRGRKTRKAQALWQ